MRFEAWCVIAAWCTLVGAKDFRWPDGVRVDTKVHFTDTDLDEDAHVNAKRDDIHHDDPLEPNNDSRVRIRIKAHRVYAPRELYSNDDKSQRYQSDGTLDSLQFCKCVSSPQCTPSVDSAKACGLGKFLCCYSRLNKGSLDNSEYFNEIDDERPFLLPGQGERAGPFPPPPGLADSTGPCHHQQQVLVGPSGPTGHIGPAKNQQILVGPNGPTGVIGPSNNQQVLIRPGRPTGVIGPTQQNRGVLVGPGGPTGVVGPTQQNYGLLVGQRGPSGVNGPAQQYGEVLSGPGGPTGVIGPDGLNRYVDIGSSGSAQRGILVGPGGSSWSIGPMGYGRRPVLVGPGGPTGIIGPYGGGRRNPAVLVGPGGPTGRIGPPRRPYYGK